MNRLSKGFMAWQDWVALHLQTHYICRQSLCCVTQCQQLDATAMPIFRCMCLVACFALVVADHSSYHSLCWEALLNAIQGPLHECGCRIQWA